MVAHLVWDQGAAGSNPVAPTTSEQVSLVPIFFIKNRSLALLFLLHPAKPIGFCGNPIAPCGTVIFESFVLPHFSQKGTLGSPVLLQALSRRLAVATTFLRECFRHKYLYSSAFTLLRHSSSIPQNLLGFAGTLLRLAAL